MTAELMNVYFSKINPGYQIGNIKGLGAVLIDWPSGRQTLELYASHVTYTALDLAARGERVVTREKLKLLNLTAQEYRENFIRRTPDGDLFITRQILTKGIAWKRPKHRIIERYQWLKPSDWTGPKPLNKNGLLPRNEERRRR